MDGSQHNNDKIIKLINSRKFNLWMLRQLPMAYFLGVRVKSCDGMIGETTIPFWWLSQNPFRSVYFAAQCAAAELATGILVVAATGNDKRISVLLASIQSDYTKKATTRVTFRSEDGGAIRKAVQQAIETGTGTTVTAVSTGYDTSGDVVSVSRLTWSFKLRQKA